MAIRNVASIFRVARRALISLPTVLAEKELMVLEFILLTINGLFVLDTWSKLPFRSLSHDFEFCSNSFTLGNVSKLPFRSLSHDFAAVVDVEAGLGRLGFYAATVERVPGTVGGT